MSTPCDKGETCPGCEKIIELLRYNQPGLDAVSYRAGTHGEFLQRMLEQLHTDELLRRQLTTRRTDDFSIALLDAWAVVGDVLTFYQERIANEGFLRTATERRSILEIARTIGYELNPGVAANTYLAFTVDTTSPNYAISLVPKGTQIQSIPTQGQLPQTFETSEEFEAHAGWNALKPRSSRHQTLAIDSEGRLFFLSLPDKTTHTSSKLKVKNYYLVNPDPSMNPEDNIAEREVNQLYLKGVANNLKAGDLLLFVGETGTYIKTAIKTIISVKADKALDRTVVYFAREPNNLPSVFDRDIEPVKSIATRLNFDTDTIAEKILKTDIREETLDGLINVNKWDRTEFLEHIGYVQTGANTRKGLKGVYALREKAAFFGGNAPAYTDTLAKDYAPSWDTDGWQIWKSYPNDTAKSEYYYPADVYLERQVEGIGNLSWVVFECPSAFSRFNVYQVEDTIGQSLTGFSLSGKVLGLKLLTENGDDVPDSSKAAGLKVRNTSAYVKSELLEPDNLLIEDDLEEPGTDVTGESVTTGVSSMMLESVVLGLKTGQPVIVNGEQTDARGVTSHEAAVLKDIIHSRGHTILYFEDALLYRYKRGTVTVNANVVPATHGETVKDEVLGSGDGTKTNQCFVLKKPPLTCVSAATPGGAESTLKLKIDNIEWEQIVSLYNTGPGKQGFIVRLDNDGVVNITFGDGRQGARLPTGQENIRATYRSGIGEKGEVAADSIKLLKTKPSGIKGVTNPIASSGSQEPETMNNARTNAPRTVLTMERIVSLQDYEDFARAYAGIGKAQAIVLWNGKTELVHVTIADSYGDTIDPGTELHKNLSKAIDTYRDRLEMVQIDTFEKHLFQLEAKLLIEEKYDVKNVLAAAQAALESAFSFDKRDFGQPVTSAEVISILQQIPGAIMVDLDKLYLTDTAYETDPELGPAQTGPASILPCSLAKWPEGEEFRKAGLLLINGVGIKLEEKE
jgi:hypothetical protein